LKPAAAAALLADRSGSSEDEEGGGEGGGPSKGRWNDAVLQHNAAIKADGKAAQGQRYAFLDQHLQVPPKLASLMDPPLLLPCSCLLPGAGLASTAGGGCHAAAPSFRLLAGAAPLHHR
jgi:hypothetical protein